MLYGPPGTGKSSFVRAIAMELNKTMFITNLKLADEKDVINQLIPNKSSIMCSCGIKVSDIQIVLVEDFDRSLAKCENELMSSILNALDGVQDATEVVRFFSANNPEIISKNKALASRMNRVFFFDKPNKNAIHKQIERIFPDNVCGNELIIGKLADMCAYQNLNMREITNYLCKFFDDDNPIHTAVDKFNDWISDLNFFCNYKEEITKKPGNDYGLI